MTNKNVAIGWINNKPTAAKNYMTDGQNLYSYGLLIGVTEGSQKVVYNYTNTGNFISSTTSRHVGLVKANPSVILRDPPR